MKQTRYTTVEQFLRDDDFIRYVMDCTSDGDSLWAGYLNAEPRTRTAYLKAYDILLHLDECENLSPEQVARLKHRVLMTTRMAGLAGRRPAC